MSNSPSPRQARPSHVAEELLGLNASIPDDLSQEAYSDVFSAMNGHHRCPVVRVTQEEMTPYLTHRQEAETLEGTDHLARR